MFKVMLTDNIAPEAVEVIARHEDLEAIPVDTLPVDELKTRIAEVDAVIIRSPTKLTADVIAAAKNLKFIGRAGVGVDNIDLEAAKAAGVTVMNAPSGNTVSTAEHTIAVMMAVARKVPQAHASLVAGGWDRKTYKGSEMFGKTLGVIGLGRVGREVVSRMAAFGMKVLGCDPSPQNTAGLPVEVVDLDTLLSSSDWITLHVPLRPETRLLLGPDEFRKMKPGVRIINCARGGVLDERSLAVALSAGRVAGAGLDVFEKEPPGEEQKKLFEFENCVFTPHLGAATAEAQLRVATDAAESVAKALLTGEVTNAVG